MGGCGLQTAPSTLPLFPLSTCSEHGARAPASPYAHGLLRHCSGSTLSRYVLFYSSYVHLCTPKLHLHYWNIEVCIAGRVAGPEARGRGSERATAGPEGSVRGPGEEDARNGGLHAECPARGCTFAVGSSSTAYSYSHSCKYESSLLLDASLTYNHGWHTNLLDAWHRNLLDAWHRNLLHACTSYDIHQCFT